jgi:hypothetical protein
LNSILLQLLSDDNKSWHEANNDLLLIAILLEKHFSYQGINEIKASIDYENGSK